MDMTQKTHRIKRVVPAVKKAFIWAVTVPVIRVTLITKEQKTFIEDANDFLEPSAIKPEFRRKQ